MNHVFDNNTKAGTAGGKLLTILANINCGDLIKTGVLEAVGAAVNFSVTLGLKILIKKKKKSCIACGDQCNQPPGKPGGFYI